MKVMAIDGIPIFDAKSGLTLTISAADCKGGDPKRPETCAAAKAIRRKHGVIDCRVHIGRVYIRQNKGNWTRYVTPGPLRSEIIAFDRGGRFSTGEYELLAVKKSAKVTGKQQGSRKRPPIRGKGKKRRPPNILTDVRNGPAV